MSGGRAQWCVARLRRTARTGRCDSALSSSVVLLLRPTCRRRRGTYSVWSQHLFEVSSLAQKLSSSSSTTTTSPRFRLAFRARLFKVQAIPLPSMSIGPPSKRTCFSHCRPPDIKASSHTWSGARPLPLQARSDMHPMVQEAGSCASHSLPLPWRSLDELNPHSVGRRCASNVGIPAMLGFRRRAASLGFQQFFTCVPRREPMVNHLLACRSNGIHVASSGLYHTAARLLGRVMQRRRGLARR